MTYMLVLQAVIAALGAALLWLTKGFVPSLSFLAGAGLVLLNLFAIVVTWPRLLAKKQVASSVSIIVFKFAILGWIIYEVVRSNWLSIGWFAAGLATVVVSVTAASFRVNSDLVAELGPNLDNADSSVPKNATKAET